MRSFMHGRFARLAAVLAVVGGVVIGEAGSALASGVAPPSFDASTLGDPLNSFGTALLAGLVILVGIVLVIKVPFALVNIAMKAIKKLSGRAQAQAG